MKQNRGPQNCGRHRGPLRSFKKEQGGGDKDTEEFGEKVEEDRVVHPAAIYGPVYSKGPGDTTEP